MNPYGARIVFQELEAVHVSYGEYDDKRTKYFILTDELFESGHKGPLIIIAKLKADIL